MPSAAWGSLASAPFLEAVRDRDYSFLSPDPAVWRTLSAFCSELLSCFWAEQGRGAQELGQEAMAAGLVLEVRVCLTRLAWNPRTWRG